MDVHRVIQQISPGLAELLQCGALKNQLVQTLLLLPAAGEQNHGPVQHLLIRQIRYGNPVGGSGNECLTDAGVGIAGKRSRVRLPDKIQNILAHGQGAAENAYIQIGLAFAGIMYDTAGKCLGRHGKIRIHMGEGVFLHP